MDCSAHRLNLLFNSDSIRLKHTSGILLTGHTFEQDLQARRLLRLPYSRTRCHMPSPHRSWRNYLPISDCAQNQVSQSRFQVSPCSRISLVRQYHESITRGYNLGLKLVGPRKGGVVFCMLIRRKPKMTIVRLASGRWRFDCRLQAGRMCDIRWTLPRLQPHFPRSRDNSLASVLYKTFS